MIRMLRDVVKYVVVFFFQAEDGIRDYKVTGVQTCALPIFYAWLKNHLRSILTIYSIIFS